MAGWNDIPNVGEIEAGYIVDITFLNTYIKAYNEKIAFLTLGTELTEIEVDAVDPQPFILTRSFITNIISKYKSLAVNDYWVKAGNFDDPAGVDPLDDDSTGYFTKTEMEALIDSEAWDIIQDPSDEIYSISEILSADVWNGMYILFRDVFNIVEQRSISSSFLSWKEYGFSRVTDSATDPVDGSSTVVTDLLDDQGDSWEAETIAEIDSGSGKKLMFTQISQRAQIIEDFNDDPRDAGTSTYSGIVDYPTSGDATFYIERIHTIENHDGDYVELDVSGQGRISANRIVDHIELDGDDVITTSKYLSEYDLVDPAAAEESYIEYDGFSSSVDGSGWHLKGDFRSLTDYVCRESDFLYDYEDAYAEDEDAGSTSIVRTATFTMVTGSYSGDADLYYKTNSSDMIYNPPAAAP